jgi:SAM-dependent methyltransferase
MVFGCLARPVIDPAGPPDGRPTPCPIRGDDGPRLSSDDMDRPRMYDELAPWFHLVTSPADYADEAADVVRLLAEQGVDLGPAHPGATLLELGSGGGNTASHLKHLARLTLTDVAPAMLALSATLNPECEHLEGDMRSLRLGRTFDAVLIHDAVMYMTTEADLRAAMETAFLHLRPGGAVVITPDFVAETFRPSTQHGGHDGADGRSLRYLEWTYDPDPADTTVVTLFAYLLREADGSARSLDDRHVEGIFPRATWLRLLADVGFRADASTDAWAREVFVGVRPRV